MSQNGAAIGQGAQLYKDIDLNTIIYAGTESIITTITEESSGLYGQVWRYPAGTSAENMANDVNNIMDGAEQVKEATITFDSNNGETDERGLTPGKDTFPEDLFQNEGYAIASWNTAPNGNGDSYLSGDVVPFIGEITLYAQYAKLYNVTVKNGTATDKNNKEIAQAIAGSTVTITAVELEKDQAFVEWSYDTTTFTLADNKSFKATFVMPEKDMTFEAQIKKILIRNVNDSYEYHEGGVTPDLKVEFEGTDTALLDGTDYEVTFTNNDKPGTATVTITISGPRKGSTTVTFKITGNTVRWLNGDGSVLEEAYYTDTMGMPSYSKNITPTGKEQTGHIITFVGWDNGTVSSKEYGKVTEYKPLFSDEKITYKVKFVDEDGTELQSSMVAYGEKPEYKGKIPTGATGFECSAEFIGWDKEIVPVTGDATYKATYKKYNEHDYQPVDGTAVAPTCTKAGKEADQKCSRCEAVITGKEIAASGHTFNQEVVDAKYLKSAADCITAAVYYKSCVCGEKSTDEKDIFTSGEPAGHKWKAATGYAPKTCEVCGLEEGQKVTYDPIKNQVFVWTKGSNEPFVLTIKRSQDDVNCFLHYLNTLLDGAEIKVEAKSGSTIITIPVETLEKLSVGEHLITVVFDDWKADFALSIAEAVATPTPAVDATPVTGDTMPLVPIAVVMVAAMAIAFAVRKKKQSAE
ncbi:MAG: InlB B-repeat-containing protein [Lachnospiraceae bacterium]|nr:InlB B-repeat-containing protein [Lachnospiraceae bacterium]